MKITTGMTALLACLLCFIATVVASSIPQDGEPGSVLNSVVAPPAPNAQDIVQPPVPGEPQIQQRVPGYFVEPAPSVIMDSQRMYDPMVAAPVASGCCETCCRKASCRKKCRCPKPEPVSMEFCLVDPCGCSHEACIEVPPCCVGEQPEISWRKGVLGRQIATLCWQCCDHEVKVIVTGSGKVRVRD
jgi:hypothetical protein